MLLIAYCAQQRKDSAMRLIGHYDSPFVRRVAVAMQLLGIPYEQLAWSVFADADKIARYNPLRRVPVLVLDDGESIIESYAIIDHLEATSGATLWPAAAAVRRRAVRITCVATGAADKAVSLVYETRLRKHPLPLWIDRCTAQINDALDELDTGQATSASSYFFGDEPTHADIAVACMWRFLTEAHADAFDFDRWPTLQRHSAACEMLPPFRRAYLPFFVSV
jgi:glutathione S-transferase